MSSSVTRILPVAFALTVLANSPAFAVGFEVLAPHRAVYDLVLKDASDRSGIDTMSGRIVYELTGNACDGISVRYRFVTSITTSEESYKTDQQTSTFETPNGMEFNFLTKSFVDEQLESTVKGAAVRTPDNLQVTLSDPSRQDLDLPPAIFISSHLVDIISAAKSGEQIVKRDIFDGSDEADEVLASTTFVGEGQVRPELIDGETAEAIAPIAELKAWPVSISYYEKSEDHTAEVTPVYEASFLLYENGISRKLTMRYPDYALSGHLVSLEMLEKQPCEPGN